MAIDTYHQLLRILRYESKDTTYKFALLRGLIEISSESPHVKPLGDYVAAPFGLLLEKWVQYYWPIVEEGIPQKQGGEKSKPLAFRITFKELTDLYRLQGGYPQFRHDYHNGKLTEAVGSRYLALLRKLRQTIADMPMKHLGQSISRDHYRIVKRPTLPTLFPIGASDLTPGWVVQNCGFYELRREYHDAFQQFGGLLIGTDAILYHWAEFTARVQRDQYGPEAFRKAFQTLTKAFEQDRQITEARACYRSVLQNTSLYCAWCPSRLSAETLVIDHLLPFSHTQNNNLWNLLPACGRCNTTKSDRIPAPDFLARRKDRILFCWQLERTGLPEAFEQQARYDLIGFDEPEFVPENVFERLSRRCEFLIQERGYDSWMTK